MPALRSGYFRGYLDSSLGFLISLELYITLLYCFTVSEGPLFLSFVDYFCQPVATMRSL